MSCTESVGLESFDERTVDDNHNQNIEDGVESSTFLPSCNKRIVEKKEKRSTSFPPPLSSLNQDGKPVFSLKPIRKDGRLDLNEVKIDPSHILFSSRGDGRLKLNLIADQDEEDEENDNDDEDVVMEAMTRKQ